MGFVDDIVDVVVPQAADSDAARRSACTRAVAAAASVCPVFKAKFDALGGVLAEICTVVGAAGEVTAITSRFCCCRRGEGAVSESRETGAQARTGVLRRWL